MLQLGSHIQTVKWDSAGITLDLSPLSEDRDQALVEQTTTRVFDDNGALTDIKRDLPKYHSLVAHECVHGWSGVVGADKQPAEFTPENLDEFIQIQVAREFVQRKVRGLDLYLIKEIDEAKKDSPA